MRIAGAVQDLMADAAVDHVDTGTGTAVLEIYSGSAPVSIGGSPAGTLLVSFDLADPAFGASSSGTATLLGVPISGTGVGDATAGYARVVNQNGDAIFDTEDVGTSGNEVTMSTTTVSTGLDVSLTAMTISAPAGSV